MRELRLPDASALARVPRTHRVLSVCGNNQHSLAVTRNLAQNGLQVLTVCNSAEGLPAYSRYASGVWVLESALGSPGFVDEVEELAQRYEVGSIMTITEKNHWALIGQRQRFEPEIHVFSPPAEAFAKATDKDYLRTLCGRFGVPVAKGATLDRFIEAGGNGLRFPLILRMRQQLDTDASRRTAWRAAYVLNEGQLQKLYQDLKGFADNILVQECHPGALVNVQVLMHRGEAFGVGCYLGEHNYPLAGGLTVQRVTFRHEGMIRDAVRLLKEIGYEGVAGPEFLYDQRRDEYIFLEMNPRFLGGLPAVIRGGFPVPFLLWQSHFQPDKMRKPNYRVGIRTRLFRPDLYWMCAMLRGDELPPSEKRLSKLEAIARFTWNCGPWTHDDSLAWRDPLPYFAERYHLLQSVLRKARGLFTRRQPAGSRPK